MSIWTFSRFCALLGGLFLLGACSGIPANEESDEGAVPERKNTALLSAEMVRGGLVLLPPDGFCIDKRGLKQNFAVLARCDSLGGRGGAQGAPLGMILVSVVASEAPVSPAIGLARLVPEGAQVQTQYDFDDFAVAQLEGEAPEGSDARHWRGVAQIGAYLVGVTAFAPSGGVMAGETGRAVMQELVQRSRDATLAKDVAGKTVSGENEPAKRKGLGALLTGLLD